MTLKHTDDSRLFIEDHYDNCSECNRSFKNEDTTHLGYTLENKLLYVGDCCLSKVEETIIRHSYKKRPYVVPSKETVLWRFMDFPKFMALILNSSIYFSRVDKLGDPFEGAKGLLNRKKEWEKYYLDFFTEALKTAPGSKMNESEIPKNAQRLLKDIKKIGKIQFKETFISCWHENNYESDAMWKIYSSTLNQAVAIKTTYERLKESLGKGLNIEIGRVNYIDYKEQFVGVNESFWFKRRSFEHEKEVRAIITSKQKKDQLGLSIPVDLNILIDKVYTSPTSELWFKKTVDLAMNKFKLQRNSTDSDMTLKSFFN